MTHGTPLARQRACDYTHNAQRQSGTTTALARYNTARATHRCTASAVEHHSGTPGEDEVVWHTTGNRGARASIRRVSGSRHVSTRVQRATTAAARTAR